MTNLRSNALALGALMLALALAGCAGNTPATQQEAATPLPVFSSDSPPVPTSTLFAPPPPTVTEPPVEIRLDIRVLGAYPSARYEINGADAPAGTELTAPVGSRISAFFKNEDTGLPVTGSELFQHTWLVYQVAESSVGVWSQGQEGNATFMAPDEPGTYKYYCTVADNRDRGLSGTFTFT